MIWRACLAALLCFSLGVRIQAQSGAASAARASIEASYRRENAALARENVAGVMVHYAPNFVYKGPKGETYRAPQLQPILVQMFAAMSNIRGVTRITKFTLKGKEARVRVSERLDAMLTRPNQPKPSRLHVVDDREDVWAQTGKAWIKKSSKSFKHTQTLDGKPFQG